jgi:hypothetical protein
VQVAVLNAMFTVGAFVTPMLLAGSMHYMHGSIWPAYYIITAIAIIEACALPLLPSPPPPAASGSSEEPSTDVEMSAASGDPPEMRPAEGEPHASTGTPATLSKLRPKPPEGEQARPGWIYLGDHGSEAMPKHYVVMTAICTLCFFANGCEHASATWLSSFGIKYRMLGEETMAIMTSNFWTAMSTRPSPRTRAW